MTNNEPEFTNPAAVPVQLCFFYNSRSNELVFSTPSPDYFFETPFDLKQGPPFLDAFQGKAADLLTAEWRACRKLKENETKSFTIAAAEPKNSFTYYFTAVRPNSSQLTDPDLLIVSVSRVASGLKPPSFDKEYADFIALAAHDLDSPLRKLSMLIDRITSKYEHITDKDVQDYVQRVRSSLSDMRTMIDNLSLLANLGSGPMKRNTCNATNLINDLLKNLQETAGEEKIEVSTADLPVLVGDTSQFKKLFSNLLTNAWKFRKKEMSLHLDISSEEATDEEKHSHGLPAGRTHIKIIIADNGIGFAQDYAEKIFQPFVRLNGKSEYPGNGIGLALCKKIVENHCGIICAEGKENFGARFIVFLPTTPD